LEEMVKSPLSGKKLDAVVLIGLTGLSFLYAYLTANLYIGKPFFVFLFYTVTVVPYLSIRQKKDWKKIILATILFGVVFAFFLDFVAEFTQTWTVVSRVFEQKILGVVPIDNILAYMMMTLWTIVFYEHFVNDKKNKEVSPNFLFGLLLGLSAVAVTLVIYIIQPSFLLQLRYPYFYMGLAAITPTILLAIKKPNMIKKMAITTSYFFVLYLILELFAVDYSYWIYTGDNYIGRITVFGRTFPFEEFFFWMMFYAASLVSYYEIFIDDLR